MFLPSNDFGNVFSGNALFEGNVHIVGNLTVDGTGGGGGGVVFASAPLAITAIKKWSAAHGLAARPKKFWAQLVCVVDDPYDGSSQGLGMIAGQAIDTHDFFDGNSGGSAFSVFADDTNVYLTVSRDITTYRVEYRTCRLDNGSDESSYNNIDGCMADTAHFKVILFAQ
jgi:hypothetical protein